MTASTRIVRLVALAALLGISSPLIAIQQRPEAPELPLPDFDIRATRRLATTSSPVLAEFERTAARARGRKVRHNPHTGAIRVLDTPGLLAPRGGSAAAIGDVVSSADTQLGLDAGDLDSLQIVRDYTSDSTGLRHVLYRQSFAGIPVYQGSVAVHIDRSGSVVRITSNAAKGANRPTVPLLSAAEAASIAADAARGQGRGGTGARLTWFALDGALRLAWHVTVEPGGIAQLYDVLVDAENGELLLRRNRVLFGEGAEGTGRVIQSDETMLRDARLPDAFPTSATNCPPQENHVLRNLIGPFRDSATVLFNTGRLQGNNTIVHRGSTAAPSAAGTFDGTQWVFDFSFNSAGSAETALFFTLNYAHDFFHDLGFTEAAGNFQADNFGRGGTGGDSVRVIARAAGRNNATFQPEPEGTSPIVSMFLFDGLGCWGQDVDGDGSLDIDGAFDTDIVLHEFHHGVSHRLNTDFTGAEADAIGEGGSDFFAYSINGDTTLAEYARPGGIRGVNEKTYGDWFCFLGFICEPHANGEIFANVMWDARERFRGDVVRGTEALAINEVHQLYIDALKLSPASPTMLDIRDAMLAADAVRNPSGGGSENFCRIWESFAARGMGLAATDTEDNGANVVEPDFGVPEGCEAPPAPPMITLTVTDATATEAGPTNGVLTISRGEARDTATTVSFSIGGSATRGTDYATITSPVTIPPGAGSVDVVIAPVDDVVVEGNETVTLTLRDSTTYVVGTPSIGSVTIVSDDILPDLVISSFAAPTTSGAGLEMDVTEVTKNQGVAASTPSVTSFFLSANSTWDAGDTLLGTRPVPALAIGETSSATTTLTMPPTVSTGSHYIIAKADGPTTIAEVSETNNTRADQVRFGPDLVVSTLSVPPTGGQGGVIAVNETTKNNGGAPAGVSVTKYFLSSNSSFSVDDTPLGSRSIGALAPAAVSSANTNVTIPASTASGSYYVIAVADEGNVVVEAIETNNNRSDLIRIGPDLQVSSISTPSRVAVGATIAVTETTRNAGQASAGPSTTAFFLSENSTMGSTDLRLPAVRNVGTLAGGAASTAVTSITLPVVAPGLWYVIGVADEGEDVVETFETNNVRAVLIHIGPDLDVTSISGPSTATVGATISVTANLKNIGGQTAAASTVRFYLSLTSTFDASDTLLGERLVPELAPNATSGGATLLTLPAGVTGRHYIIAVADADGVVTESSESNNTGSRVITITP